MTEHERDRQRRQPSPGTRNRASSDGAAPRRRPASRPATGPGGLELARGRGLQRSTLWDDEEIPTAEPLRARWDPVPPPQPERGGRRRADDAQPGRSRARRDRTRPDGGDPDGPSRRPPRRRSRIGWFVHHYGWRAYALPVLTALTVVAIVDMFGSSRPSSADVGHDAAGASVTVITVNSTVPTTITLQQPGATTTVMDSTATGGAATAKTDPATAETGLAAAHTADAVPTAHGDPADAFRGVTLGLLPDGAPFARTGAGTFHVIDGDEKTLGDGPQTYTFTIEAEDGIETAGADRQFAADVMAILADQRSWIGGDDITLRRVDSGDPDFRITLTSQMTVREPDSCGWDVQLEASCFNRIPERVFINDARWIRGSAVYGPDLASYRVYAINHEVGHALGHHHQPCPTDGGLAPVMMQQSWSTSDDDLAKLSPGGPVQADGKVCRYNPFPFPDHSP